MELDIKELDMDIIIPYIRNIKLDWTEFIDMDLRGRDFAFNVAVWDIWLVD